MGSGCLPLGAFQVSLHGLRWCCCAKCCSCVDLQGQPELYRGESPKPDWLNMGFLFREKVDFAWSSGGQRESVVKRTSEAAISFCYKMGILSPLFQEYPPHSLCQVSWCANSRRSQEATEAQWGLQGRAFTMCPGCRGSSRPDWLKAFTFWCSSGFRAFLKLYLTPTISFCYVQGVASLRGMLVQPYWLGLMAQALKETVLVV